MRLGTWLKLLIPVLASITGLVALRMLGPDVIDQHRLSALLGPLGKWAPVAFVSALAVRPLTFLPGQVFTAVGGLLFGSLAATVYALIGSFLAAGVTFWTARAFGARAVERWSGAQYQAIRGCAEKHAFGFALVMCINPLMPTDIAIAAAAAAGARFWPTALGMLIGTIPGTFVTALFGSSLGQGKAVTTALAASGMVLSLVLGVVLARRVAKELATPPPTPDRASVAPHVPVPSF